MVAGIVLLLCVLWVVSAKPTSMLLDRFWTVEIDSRPISRLGFVAPGNNVTRIITWVVAGLAIVAGICGLIAAASLSSLTGLSGVSTSNLIPGWYLAVTYIIGAVNLLIYIGVAVMLALPASNEYFRKTP